MVSELLAVDDYLVLPTFSSGRFAKVVAEDFPIVSLDVSSGSIHVRNDKLFSFARDEFGFQLGVRQGPDFDLQVIHEFGDVHPRAVSSSGSPDEFFFVANREQTSTLWKSDGTANGTNEVLSLDDQRVGQVEQAGDRIYITTFSGDNTRSSISLLEDGTFRRLETFSGFVRLWTLDDEAFGEVFVEGATQQYHLREEMVERVDIPGNAIFLGVREGKLVFGSPGSLPPSTVDLGTFDLVTKETQLLRTINTPTQSANPTNLVESAGYLSVTTRDGVQIYDGETSRKILDGGQVTLAHAFGDRVVYVNSGGEVLEDGRVETFAQLLIGDASGGELREFGKIIEPRHDEISVYSVGSTLFIYDVRNDQIWVSDDGNDMVPLSDIAPQWRSLPSLDVPRSVGIISANDDALFFMDHIDRETQVWRTDGTTDGTIPIGEASLNPVNVIATTEGVYLVVDDLENSVRSERHHLYVADSQGQSVKLVESFSQRPQVLDTQLGPFVVESTGDQRILRNSKLEMVADLGPRGLIDFVDLETESDEFFFAEIEKVPFFELGSTTITSVTLSIWRSDGTQTGTRRIVRQPIAPGSDVEMALLDGMLSTVSCRRLARVSCGLPTGRMNRHTSTTFPVSNLQVDSLS